MIAVIAGASGLVGSKLLTLLLEDSRYSRVITLVRRPLPIQHPKLEIVLVQDFSKILDFSSQLAGDHYFCCLGTTIKTAGNRPAFMKVDLDAVVDFGKCAEKNQGQRFLVISASGASSRSGVFYNRVKGQAEDALRGLKLKSLVIFRPGLLMGQRSESRPGEAFAIQVIQALSPAFPKKWISRVATPVDDLAALMLSEANRVSSGVTCIEASEITKPF